MFHRVYLLREQRNIFLCVFLLGQFCKAKDNRFLRQKVRKGKKVLDTRRKKKKSYKKHIKRYPNRSYSEPKGIGFVTQDR